MKRSLLIPFVLMTMLLRAQDPITLNDNVQEVILMPYQVAFFNDSTNRITMDDILSPGSNLQFQKRPDYQNKDFKPNTSYWIRYPLRHSPETSKIWLLEFYDQTIDHIEVYLPLPNGGYEKVVMGDAVPFEHRTLHHKNFEVLLPAHTDSVAVYYFKIRSHEFADMRIALRSIDRFVYYALNEYLLFGTFYGMILIISLYNFLVYLAIREIKNIYYICYIISVGLYAITLDGIGFQYLWPNNPGWNDYVGGITLYSLIFWALVFTRRFLSSKTTSPKLDQGLLAMIVLRTGYFLFAAFFKPSLFAYRFIDLISLSLIFYTGISVWVRGYRPARFFVIAYGFLFTGFFIRGLVYLNLLPFTTLTHYSLHISFGIEMLFLTFALGDRIRILKDNRDRAMRRIIDQHETNMKLKEKVTRELEQKVRERTLALNDKAEELAESNQKLIQQATEINEINSILDLDNWKLKNRVKEVLEERLHETTMDYAEFRTLYPDELSCFRFIDDLKWRQGFQCRKCGNEKFFDGASKFARRCTRCGYNESITAFTIFQGVKFPIDKAFYLAYLTALGRSEQTLEQLSEQLSLRLNTVWSFRKKVEEALANLKQHGRYVRASRWEDVILSNEGDRVNFPKRAKRQSWPK